MLFRTLQAGWAVLVALAGAAIAPGQVVQPAVAVKFLSFTAGAGNPADQTKYLDIRNTTARPLTVERLASSRPWMEAGQPGITIAPSEAGRIAVTVHPAGLAPGFHRALLSLHTSGGDFQLPVNLTIATASPVRLFPAGKRFRVETGVPGRHAAAIAVRTSGSESVQWLASVLPGADWLHLETFSGASPARIRYSIDPALASGLAAGAYYGAIRVIVGGQTAAPLDFVVVLHVSSQHSEKPAPETNTRAFAAAGCSPQNMIAVQSGISNNFRQTAAWPALLSVRLSDNCGTPISGAAVTAMFTNGDSPLTLESLDPGTGVYSATWTPRSSQQSVTITLRASAPGLPAATLTVNGSVAASEAPVVMPNGILHAFAPQPGGALSPGGIVQIFGAHLAQTTMAAPSMPLPLTLDGTSVMIGGIRAPLYFVSPGQINAQIPLELEPNREYQVIVNVHGALTVPETIAVAAGAPGIPTKSGYAVAQHRNRTWVTETSPARPGEIISFQVAGLGATDLPMESGAPAPADRPAHPLDAPGLSLNGEQASVLSAELTPGQVGLYQIDFQVPENTPDGALPLAVSQDEVRSNTALLPVMRP